MGRILHWDVWILCTCDASCALRVPKRRLDRPHRQALYYAAGAQIILASEGLAQSADLDRIPERGPGPMNRYVRDPSCHEVAGL